MLQDLFLAPHSSLTCIDCERILGRLKPSCTTHVLPPPMHTHVLEIISQDDLEQEGGRYTGHCRSLHHIHDR